jgi:peptidoglycan hydrolase-like protein with peptidoglycan-binding domain
MKNIPLKGLFVFASVIFVTSSASAMTCTNLTKALSKGSENSEVLKLQQFLFDGGYLTAKPNGYFGNGTVVAVKKFQGASRLSQLGSVGPGTRGKVKEISCGNTSSTSVVILKKEIATSSVTKMSADTSVSGNGFMEIGKDYDYFYNLIGVNDKLAYIASKKIKDSYNTRTFVVYDGREISSKYDFVTGLVKIGNKLAYSATSKDGGGNVIVYDGVEVSTKLCLNAYAPTNINGKLAFNCSQKNGSALMVLDGIEIPHEKRYGLDSHTPPVDIGGKLAYAVIDTGDTFHWKSTLLVDGVDIGLTKYTSIDQLYSANGKPLFMARKLPDNVEHALVYNGVEIAKDYNYIDSVVQVGDKSIFIARKDEGRSSVYTMFVDGVAQSTKYDVIAGLAEIDGSVAYHAETGKKSFIVYKGKEFGKEYDSVGGPANINNKLAFVATKNSKSFVVMEK